MSKINKKSTNNIASIISTATDTVNSDVIVDTAVSNESSNVNTLAILPECAKALNDAIVDAPVIAEAMAVNVPKVIASSPVVVNDVSLDSANIRRAKNGLPPRDRPSSPRVARNDIFGNYRPTTPKR